MTLAVGGSGQSLQIIDSVLQHFDRNRQVRFWQREAGGLLFARFNLPTIEVVEATGPRRTDRRTRYSYSPDIDAERREIDHRFSRGLHFVGCWHTHPEDVASPSQVDILNTAECVKRSHHGLNGFVMVIVGRKAVPESLFVSVCDETSVYPIFTEKPTDPESAPAPQTNLEPLRAVRTDEPSPSASFVIRPAILTP